MERVWASRKIARNVAHANMRRAGIVHPNKPRYGIRSGMVTRLPSYFAQSWRSAANE